MLVDIKIIDLDDRRYFKMLVSDYISLNQIQSLLEVPQEYEMLVNGFYETNYYRLQPYDQITFIIDPINKRIQNCN